MSTATWRRGVRAAKYHNQKSMACAYGYSHRSKLEAALCQLIAVREKAGELRHVGHEVRVKLSAAGIVYIPDFECEDENGKLYIEAKGFETDAWRIKRRLWIHYGPGRLEIWKGTNLRPFLDELLTPII